MTLLAAHAFGDTAPADLAVEFTVNAATAAQLSLITGARAGTSALEKNSSLSANELLIAPLASSVSTLRFSFRVMGTGLSASRSFVRLKEGAVIHLSLTQSLNGGDLQVHRGDYSGTLLGTVAGFFNPSTWRWIEVKVVIHDSTGSVEIRDGSGAVLLALSGIDTRNAGTSGVIDALSFFNMTSSTNRVALQDLVVWDESGSGMNTWSGETRVDSLVPTAAGTTTQLTPSAGSNWQCVDELPMAVADYVSSSTVGHRDLYTLGNLPFTPVTVFGVIATAVGSKDDAGSSTLLLPVKSGATTSAGSGSTLELATYKRFRRVFETDPNTSAAWTVSAINALEAGVEVGS